MKHRGILYLVGVIALVALVVTACSPQEVEVTRVVTEQVEVAGDTVEVTRVVEVEVEMPVEVAADRFPEGTSISLLQWSHFVPQYDTWIDEFAPAWGKSVGVEMSVEHIDFTQLFPNLTAAIDAGEGPTIFELVIGGSLFVQGIHDLTDINLQAQEMFGEQIETCKANSYLPRTDSYYGFCHGWIPDPGDYNKTLWTEAGFPDGPSTWEDLRQGGNFIRDELGVPMGIGLSPEIDSEMAARAIIWSFGGSVQDENENVVINSPEVIEAVEFMASLYRDTMTEEVFAWNAASNNQGLIAGELSYILNSISAYRSLQKIDPEAADEIFFTEALRGPRGDQHASAHVWQIYVIPNYVEGVELEAAKAFILHHTANYSQAVFNSELYNFPAFKSTVPELYEEGGWLDVDPFGSRPNDKLKVLGTAEGWVTHLGYPGPSNPAVVRVYATNIVSNMMAQVAKGERTPAEAVAEAEAQIIPIFEEWRALGYVGGGE
jgi:multiple sugar transport system substrate-binding protein